MKVVGGLFSVPATQYFASEDVKTKILKLLIHECKCIYSDRLVDSNDLQLFNLTLNETLVEFTEKSLEEIQNFMPEEELPIKKQGSKIIEASENE